MSDGFDITVLGLEGWQAAGGAALLAVFGPSARTLGKALGDFTDYRARNLLRIGERGKRKLDEQERQDEDGQVHPRMAHSVVEDGSWIDDDVHQEYLAGLLVTSRTPDGKDDHAAYLSRLVTRLTAAQIRLHHALYQPLLGIGMEGGRNLKLWTDLPACGVYLPAADVVAITGSPVHRWNEEAGDMLRVLSVEGIIHGSEWGVGPGSELQFGRPVGDGLHVTPSALGAELFMHAYGIKPATANELLLRQELPPFDPPGPVSPRALIASIH